MNIRIIHQITTFTAVSIFSVVVNAANLITQTDVSLFDSTGINFIDQDNTFIDQFPDITAPTITHNAQLLDGSTLLGSSNLEVDLTQGSIKSYADSSLSTSDPRIISSTATVNYSDRLRLFGSGVDQTVNVQMVLGLTGEVSGDLGTAASLVYSLEGDIRNQLFMPDAQPFSFNDIISLDVFVPGLGAPFIDFSIALTAQSTGIGISDLSNTLTYSFIIPDSITAEMESGLPVVGTVPVPAAIWLFGSGLIGLIGVAGRKVRV